MVLRDFGSLLRGVNFIRCSDALRTQDAPLKRLRHAGSVTHPSFSHFHTFRFFSFFEIQPVTFRRRHARDRLVFKIP